MHVLCKALFRPAVSWNKIREDECRAPVCRAAQLIEFLIAITIMDATIT